MAVPKSLAPRQTRRLAATALLLAAATGCVSTKAMLVDRTAPKLAPTCPDAVVMYTTPARIGEETDSGWVAHRYREIAYLSAEGSSTWTTEEGMFHSMRQKAASLGANGIVLDPAGVKDAGDVEQFLLGASASRRGKALAVWVPADSGRTAATCANPPESPKRDSFGRSEN